MPKVDAAVDLVESSFYDRATGDATLTDELGHTASDERIIHGRPRDVMDVEGKPSADELPLLGYFGVTGPEEGGGYGAVVVQCDLFVPSEGTEGGIDKVAAIDAALLGLFHRTDWTFDGRRYFCREVSWRRGGSEDVLHRIRELRIGIGG